jgi:hypothetical protein
MFNVKSATMPIRINPNEGLRMWDNNLDGLVDYEQSNNTDRIGICLDEHSMLCVEIARDENEISANYNPMGFSVTALPTKQEACNLKEDQNISSIEFKVIPISTWLNDINKSQFLYVMGETVHVYDDILNHDRSWKVLDPAKDVVCDSDCDVAICIGPWELAIYLENEYDDDRTYADYAYDNNDDVYYTEPWVSIVNLFKDDILVDRVVFDFDKIE